MRHTGCVSSFLGNSYIHTPIPLQGDTFLRFYPVSLIYCSVTQSRCASRGTFPPKQKRSLGWVPILTVILLLFLMWGLTQAEFAHVTVTIGTPPPIINIHLTPVPTH